MNLNAPFQELLEKNDLEIKLKASMAEWENLKKELVFNIKAVAICFTYYLFT